MNAPGALHLAVTITDKGNFLWSESMFVEDKSYSNVDQVSWLRA